MNKLSLSEIEKHRHATNIPKNILKDEIDDQQWWDYSDEMIEQGLKTTEQKENWAEYKQSEEKDYTLKKKRSTKKSKGQYVSGFGVYYLRKCRNPNGDIQSDILPALFAPWQVILYWYKYILKLSQNNQDRLYNDIRNFGFQSSLQLQGQWLSHFSYYIFPMLSFS